MVLFFGIGPPFVNPGVCPSGQHLDSHWEGASSQWSASILLGGALPLSGVVPVGLGNGAGDCPPTSPIFQKSIFLFPFYLFFGRKLYSFSKGMVSYFCLLLGMLVAKWKPTPCYRDAFSVDYPSGLVGGKAWQKHYKTTFSPFYGRFFLVTKRTFFFFFWGGRLLYRCSILGGPGILGLALGFFTPSQLSIEFVIVGGWLTHGDVALDSCAQFLAVGEHRLVPSGTRSVCHQLRKAGHLSCLVSCLPGSGCWRSCWSWGC